MAIKLTLRNYLERRLFAAEDKWDRENPDKPFPGLNVYCGPAGMTQVARLTEIHSDFFILKGDEGFTMVPFEANFVFAIRE